MFSEKSLSVFKGGQANIRRLAEGAGYSLCGGIMDISSGGGTEDDGLLVVFFSWLAKDAGFPMFSQRWVVEKEKTKHSLKIADCSTCGVLSSSHSGGHLMFIETPWERITLYGKGAGGINPADVEGLLLRSSLARR
ncbi:MAG TPA: hypothetical protein VMV71_01035 [Candidatus Paceibacterota bacterium]|nr:hypothetical protein [Candidatus Paceibacterota bacterium]